MNSEQSNLEFSRQRSLYCEVLRSFRPEGVKSQPAEATSRNSLQAFGKLLLACPNEEMLKTHIQAHPAEAEEFLRLAQRTIEVSVGAGAEAFLKSAQETGKPFRIFASAVLSGAYLL